MSRDSHNFASCEGIRSLSVTAAPSGRSSPPSADLSTDLFYDQEEAIRRAIRGTWRPGHAAAVPVPQASAGWPARSSFGAGSSSQRDLAEAALRGVSGGGALDQAGGASATEHAAACSCPAAEASSSNGPEAHGSSLHRIASFLGGENLAPASASPTAALTTALTTALHRVGLSGLHTLLGTRGEATHSGASFRRQASLGATVSMILSKDSDRRRKGPGQNLQPAAPGPKTDPHMGGGTLPGGQHLIGLRTERPLSSDTGQPSRATGSSLAPAAAAAACSQAPPAATAPLEGPVADADNGEWTEFDFSEGPRAVAARGAPFVPPSPLHCGTAASYSGAFNCGLFGSGEVRVAAKPPRRSGEQGRLSGSLTRPSTGNPSSPLAQPGGDRDATTASWPTSASAWARAMLQGRRKTSHSRSSDGSRRDNVVEEEGKPRCSVDSKLKAAADGCDAARHSGCRSSYSQSPGASHGSTSQRGPSAREPLAAGAEPGSSRPSAAGSRSEGGTASGRRDSAYARLRVPSDSDHAMMPRPRPPPPTAPLPTSAEASWAGIEPESASQRFKSMQEKTLSLIMSVDDEVADPTADTDVVLACERSLHSSRRSSNVGQGGTGTARFIELPVASRGGSLAALRACATPIPLKLGVPRASSSAWALAVTGWAASLAAVCAHGCLMLALGFIKETHLFVFAVVAALVLASGNAIIACARYATRWAKALAAFARGLGASAGATTAGLAAAALLKLLSSTISAADPPVAYFTSPGSPSRSIPGMLHGELSPTVSTDHTPSNSSGRINLVTRYVMPLAQVL